MKPVDIGNNDLNADWVKVLPQHEGEIELHEGLMRSDDVKGGPGSGHHGHSGRPGKRGGSAPGSSIANLRGRVPLTREEINRLPSNEADKAGLEGMNRLSTSMSKAGHSSHWRHASTSAREITKERIVKDITDKVMGEPPGSLEVVGGKPVDPDMVLWMKEYMDREREVNEFVKQWAHSSNDEDMRSLAIQRDAAEEFGLPLSEFTRERIEWAEGRESRYWDDQLAGGKPLLWRELPKDKSLLPSSQQRRILRAMYDNTQAKLKENGFKPGSYITMFRGVRLPKEQVAGLDQGSKFNFTGNAIESWSLGLDVAMSFAGTGGTDRRSWRGVVIKASFPIEMILSTALTGFGCLTEGEITVLGSDGEAEVVGVS